MSQKAVFACALCKTETIHGNFRGGDDYTPKFPCLPCLRVTIHQFSRYCYVDERSDPQRIREALGRSA